MMTKMVAINQSVDVAQIKTPVVGMVERGGRVKAKVQDKTKLKFKDLRRMVREMWTLPVASLLQMNTVVIRLSSISLIMKPSIIRFPMLSDISIRITIEGFWAILKRGIVGQYHKVSIRY